MAFLWIEDKGINYIWSTFSCLTLICLKLRGKPLGKIYWPTQWQKSFQFILIPFCGSPPRWPDIRAQDYESWIENQPVRKYPKRGAFSWHVSHGGTFSWHVLMACEPQFWLFVSYLQRWSKKRTSNNFLERRSISKSLGSGWFWRNPIA